ncbi:MAG: YraN family protein [Hyphomicrobiales bacterium]
MARPDVSRRRKAYRLGYLAEWIAAGFLLIKGYRILALRYSAHSGEIDIIAMRRDIVVFVEVKARAHREAGLMAISQEKQRRFARAVHHWVGRNPWSMNRTLRCDAIIVLPMRLPYHLEDAFQLSMA